MKLMVFFSIIEWGMCLGADEGKKFITHRIMKSISNTRSIY